MCETDKSITGSTKNLITLNGQRQYGLIDFCLHDDDDDDDDEAECLIFSCWTPSCHV